MHFKILTIIISVLTVVSSAAILPRNILNILEDFNSAHKKVEALTRRITEYSSAFRHAALLGWDGSVAGDAVTKLTNTINAKQGNFDNTDSEAVTRRTLQLRDDALAMLTEIDNKLTTLTKSDFVGKQVALGLNNFHVLIDNLHNAIAGRVTMEDKILCQEYYNEIHWKYRQTYNNYALQKQNPGASTNSKTMGLTIKKKKHDEDEDSV